MSLLEFPFPPSPVWVKICGITSLGDALAALDAGADALGFILFPKSSRYISPGDAVAIINKLPVGTVTVAVTVNAVEQLDSASSDDPLSRFTAWQLHGQENAVDCARLAKKKPMIKAVPAGRLSEEEVIAYESAGVSAYLLDTPSPLHGGTGKTFDWSEATAFREKTRLPILLSGGLNCGNLANALEFVHPNGVDVCSGVEFATGKKDLAKVREFIKICKKL